MPIKEEHPQTITVPGIQFWSLEFSSSLSVASASGPGAKIKEEQQ